MTTPPFLATAYFSLNMIVVDVPSVTSVTRIPSSPKNCQLAAKLLRPQLVLPVGEEELRVGTRLARAGIGRCLSDGELGGEPSMLRMRFHLAEMVNGGRVLPAAARLGRTVARMPSPADLVPDLQALLR